MRKLIITLVIISAGLLASCTPAQVARWNSVVGGSNDTLGAQAAHYNDLRCANPDGFVQGIEAYGVDPLWLAGDELPAECPAPAHSHTVEGLIGLHFSDSAFATRVARCESGLNPGATGAAGERGIFQIHPVNRGYVESLGFTWDQMYQAEPNVIVAATMRAQYGWGPWTCARLV